MTSRNIDVRVLIEKLDDVLHCLDDNDLALPAIKIEEAINALKQQEIGKSTTKEPEE